MFESGSFIFFVRAGFEQIFDTESTSGLQMLGLQEETICSNIASKSCTYHYRVVFRVGCPTLHFDLANSVIDFELYGPNKKLIGEKVRYPAAGLYNLNLSHFVCNLFVVKPLPHLVALRTSFTNGNVDSGLFLFDVFVNLVRVPTKENFNASSTSSDEEKSDSGSSNSSSNSSPVKRSPPPPKMNIRETQHFKVFAYITSTTRTYYKYDKVKHADAQMPPFTNIKLSSPFMKLLLWFSFLQGNYFALRVMSKFLSLILAFFFAKLVLSTEYYYKSWSGFPLSMLTIVAISAMILMELMMVVLLYRYLSLLDTTYVLLNHNLFTKRKRGWCQWNFNVYPFLCSLVVMALIGGCTYCFYYIITHLYILSQTQSFYLCGIMANTMVLIGGILHITKLVLDNNAFGQAHRQAAETKLLQDTFERDKLSTTDDSGSSPIETILPSLYLMSKSPMATTGVDLKSMLASAIKLDSPTGKIKRKRRVTSARKPLERSKYSEPDELTSEEQVKADLKHELEDFNNLHRSSLLRKFSVPDENEKVASLRRASILLQTKSMATGHKTFGMFTDNDEPSSKTSSKGVLTSVPGTLDQLE